MLLLTCAIINDGVFLDMLHQLFFEMYEHIDAINEFTNVHHKYHASHNNDI